MNLRVVFRVVAFSALAGWAGSVFGQGTLTPPGAPGATQKTLQQIEPRFDLQAATPPPGVTSDANHDYIISQPGSYYLSSNLKMTKPACIDIAAAGVTLDLSGFTISSAYSGVVAYLVELEPAAIRCVVCNGNIEGGSDSNTFGAAYNRNAAPSATEVTFRNLRVTGCYNGLGCGAGWQVEGCSASDNLNAGISADGACICLNSTADRNQVGFSGGPMTITHCSASENTTAGFSAAGTYLNCEADGNSAGFGTSAGSFTNCTASNSTDTGFFASASVSFSGCTATNNAKYGFSVTDGVTLTNCVANNNRFGGFIGGISSDQGDRVSFTHCIANENGGAAGQDGNGIDCRAHCRLVDCSAGKNFGIGIHTNDECSVTGCIVESNGTSGVAGRGVGISVGNKAQVKGCTVTSNGADGILAVEGCDIVDNFLTGNCTTVSPAGSAIRVTGSSNRIDNNTLTDNVQIGINAPQQRNLIVRNIARSNGLNYVIGVDNRMAQIVTPAALGTAISGGNAGGPGGFAGVDPWANLSY
jgi:hypothetical protein